jgi:two-component system response regulator AgrA
MLSIFVCEDNKEQRERFAKTIQDITAIENYNMKLMLATENPHELIKYVSENGGCGLYFLDIDLKASINGIELATKIREYDPRGFIVFVTTHAEMSYLTFLYKVEAMDYIIKDNYNNIKERIHQCMDNANTKHSSKDTDNGKVFNLNINDRIIKIDYNKILFFETSSTIHKVVLHGTNRQIEFYAKMKDIEEKLDSRFYRCHKSYIVNKDNISEINIKKRYIDMINGEKCFISTRMLKGLIK